MPRPMPVIDLARLLGPNFRQRRASAQHPGEPDPPRPLEEEPSNVARMPKAKSDDTSKSTDESAGDSKPKANNRRVTMSPLEAEATKLPGGNTNIQAMVNKNEASSESGGIHGTVPGQNESVAAATSKAAEDTEYQEKVPSKKRPLSTETMKNVPSTSKKQKVPSQRKSKGKKPPPNPPATTTIAYEIAPSSLNRCVPVAVGSAEVLSALFDANTNEALPALKEIANFPQYCRMRVVEGTRGCVMCGFSRLFFVSQKKGKQKTRAPFIVKGYNGVCSSCEAPVWLVAENGLQIRFCSMCKQFRPLEAFATRSPKTNSLLCSCSRCRDRKKDNYRKAKQQGDTGLLSPDSLQRPSEYISRPNQVAETGQPPQGEDSNMARNSGSERTNGDEGNLVQANASVSETPRECETTKLVGSLNLQEIADMDESETSLLSRGARGLKAGTVKGRDEASAVATRKVVPSTNGNGPAVEKKRPASIGTSNVTSSSKEQKGLVVRSLNKPKEAPKVQAFPGVDSSQDDMTLAEMESAANGLDCQQLGSNTVTSSMERNLTVAVTASTSTEGHAVSNDCVFEETDIASPWLEAFEIAGSVEGNETELTRSAVGAALQAKPAGAADNVDGIAAAARRIISWK